MFAGPALAGLVLAVSGMEATLVVMACVAWSALLVLPIKETPPVPGAAAIRRSGSSLRRLRRDVADARPPPADGVLSGQALTAGCINVLVVVTALALLELGEVSVAGRRRRSRSAARRRRHRAPVHRTRLTVRSSSERCLGPAARRHRGMAERRRRPRRARARRRRQHARRRRRIHAAQRIAPDDVLARVFGVVETVFYLAIGIGSILAPLLVETAGARWALVAVGLFLPVLVFARARRIVGIDADAVVPVHELELLGLVPMFAPLPQLSLERVARQLIPVEAGAGTNVIVQGDEGDRFYVIDEGEVDVVADGRHIASLGRAMASERSPSCATCRARRRSLPARR